MPRMTPKEKLSVVQRTASYAGWASMALLMGSLLYWLYLSNIGQNRNWIVNTGLGIGIGLLAYFVVGMGAVIIRNLRSPEGKRALRNATLVIAILAILSIANVLAYRRHAQWDLTGNRRLTLAPTTKRILKDLKQKIKATAFFTSSARRRGENMQAGQVRDLLNQYADQSSNFKFEIVDYMREPARMMSEKLTTEPPVTIFTNDKGAREEVKGTGEKDFTGALLKLTRKEKRKIYFTEGHGELSPNSMDRNGASVVKQVLTDQQHEIASLNLMGKERTVPKDCSVLVVGGPQVEFKPEEVKAVKDYLDAGGDALVLLRVAGPSMEALLKDWGVKVGENVVLQIVDLGGQTGILRGLRIIAFEPHDVTRGLSALAFPLLRTVEPITPAPTGIVVTPIIKTSADTVSKPIGRGQNQISALTSSDPRGPFTVAALAEKTTGDKKGRIITIGNAEYASDMLAGDPSSSNRYLFTNAVNYLADEDALVDIPPKDDPPDQVFLTPEQRARTFFINLLLFPAACLFMAMFVWWKRR